MGEVRSESGAICCYFALLIWGSILLSSSLDYMDSKKYLGTLKKADTFGSGDDSQVKEYFLYEANGKNETCVIERLASYSNKKKANDAADDKKIGTTRQIYVQNKHHDKCTDYMGIIEDNYTAGIVLLCLFGLPIVIVLGAMCCNCRGKIVEGANGSDAPQTLAAIPVVVARPRSAGDTTPAVTATAVSMNRSTAPLAEVQLADVEANIDVEV